MSVYIDIIEHFLELNPSIVESGFQRQHIFHSILSYCEQEESESTRLEMMYHFSLYQKYLASVLKKEKARIAGSIAAIQERPLSLNSDIARVGMNALYFPVVAYDDYVNGQYDEAIVGLERSLSMFGTLYEHGFQEAILAIIDQNMNILRVHCAEGDDERALAVAVNLLDFLFCGCGKEIFHHANLAAIFSPLELRSIVDFFTDAVMLKMLHNPDLAERFLSRLLPMHEQWAAGAMRDACGLLTVMQNGSDASDLSVDTCALALPQLPFSWQVLLIHSLLEEAELSEKDPRSIALQRYLNSVHAYPKFAALKWRTALFAQEV